MNPDIFYALINPPSSRRHKIVGQIRLNAHEIVEFLESSGCPGEDLDAAILHLYKALTYAEKSLALADMSGGKESELKQGKKMSMPSQKCSSVSCNSAQGVLLEMAALVTEAFNCLDDYEDATGETIESLRENLFDSFAEINKITSDKSDNLTALGKAIKRNQTKGANCKIQL